MSMLDTKHSICEKVDLMILFFLKNLPEAYSKPLSKLGLSTDLDYENLKKDVRGRCNSQ